MRYFLLNSIQLGANTLSVGREIDDAVTPIDKLLGAGAILYPSGDARLEATAKFILDQRTSHGMEETRAQAMLLAIIASLGSNAPINANPDLTRDVWYIDRANSLGHASDSNDGLTPKTALLTDAERQRRVKGGTLQPKSGTVTVNYLSGEPTVGANVDRFDLTTAELGADVFFVVNGPTPTRVRTGAITAVTALDRTNGVTPGGNPLKITDTGVTTWEVGDRITMLTGTNAGKRMWIVRDNGSGVAECTPLLSKQVNASMTQGTPSIGDTYAVETCAKLVISESTIRTKGRLSSFFSGFTISDMWIVGAGNSDSLSLNGDISHLNIALDGCRIDMRIDSASTVDLFNCYCTAGEWGRRSSGQQFFGGFLSCGFMIQRPGNFLVLDQDVYVNGSLSMGPDSTLLLGAAGFFHCPGDAINLTGGDAVVGTLGGFFAVTEGVYGNNNGGYGVRVGSGSTVRYVTNGKITLTGTSGDWKLPAAAPSYFSASAGTFPAATAGTPNTWANLIAAQPGGFGNNAHDPDAMAHILKVA